MKILISAVLAALLFVGCAKEEVNGFDNKIRYAQNFVIDPVSGDTTYSLVMPSGFTPNGDGLNDQYRVYGTGIDPGSFYMRIYDRYGNLVGTSPNLYTGWYGAIMGQSEVTGLEVFEVKIELLDTAGHQHKYQYAIVELP